jgi:hypothetical protein
MLEKWFKTGRERGNQTIMLLRGTWSFMRSHGQDVSRRWCTLITDLELTLVTKLFVEERWPDAECSREG